MTMLKNKNITFSIFLVYLIMVSPMAKAILGEPDTSISIFFGPEYPWVGLFGGPKLTGPFNISLIHIPSIHGVVFCTHNGRTSPNTRSTPAFPNAEVELQCGKHNTVISSTTTNAAGIFSIPPNSIQMLLSTLLSRCKLAVTTPLTNCNAVLPSFGSLVSPLTVIGTTVFGGVLNVVSLAPTGFLLTA